MDILSCAHPLKCMTEEGKEECELQAEVLGIVKGPLKFAKTMEV